MPRASAEASVKLNGAAAVQQRLRPTVNSAGLVDYLTSSMVPLTTAGIHGLFQGMTGLVIPIDTDICACDRGRRRDRAHRRAEWHLLFPEHVETLQARSALRSTRAASITESLHQSSPQTGVSA